MMIIIGFLLGLVYASFLEWGIHKYLFHKLGRKKDSIFAYHLRGHHVLAKKNGFVDLTASRVESVGMMFLILLHIPVIFYSVSFWAAITLYALAFKFLHGYQHSNPEFTKKHMKWHWDHHMKNPNKNYNVVLPIADKIMRTNG